MIAPNRRNGRKDNRGGDRKSSAFRKSLAFRRRIDPNSIEQQKLSRMADDMPEMEEESSGSYESGDLSLNLDPEQMQRVAELQRGWPEHIKRRRAGLDEEGAGVEIHTARVVDLVTGINKAMRENDNADL